MFERIFGFFNPPTSPQILKSHFLEHNQKNWYKIQYMNRDKMKGIQQPRPLSPTPQIAADGY